MLLLEVLPDSMARDSVRRCFRGGLLPISASPPAVLTGVVTDIMENGHAKVYMVHRPGVADARANAAPALMAPKMEASDFRGAELDGTGVKKGSSWPSCNREGQGLPLLPVWAVPLAQRVASSDKATSKLVPSGFRMLDALLPAIAGTSTLVSAPTRAALTEHLIQLVQHITHFCGTEAKYPALVHKPIVILASVGATSGHLGSIRAACADAGAALVAASVEDPLGQRYLAPFSALAHAQSLVRDGHEVVLLLDDLTAHADAARQVAGVSWADMLAAPTYTGQLFDAAAVSQCGSGSLTIFAGAVGVPSGGPGVPHGTVEYAGSSSQPSRAASSSVAGRAQGIIAGGKGDPRHISAAQTKTQAWLDDAVSRAHRTYHVTGMGPQSATSPMPLLPVPEEITSWTTGHTGQGPALQSYAAALRSLLLEASTLGHAAGLALSYGIVPEADVDAQLEYLAKIRLLLNPSPLLLQEARQSTSRVAGVRLGLRSTGVGSEGLAAFDDAQAANLSAVSAPTQHSPARVQKQVQDVSQAPSVSPSRASSWSTWLPSKSQSLSWQAILPSMPGKREFCTEGGPGEPSGLESKMTPEQLAALRHVRARRKPGAAAAKPVGGGGQASQRELPQNTTAGDKWSDDDIDALIGVLEAGGTDFQDGPSCQTDGDVRGDEEREHSSDQAAVQASERRLPDTHTAPEVHARLGQKLSDVHTASPQRLLAVLFALVHGYVSQVPPARLLEFEQGLFRALSSSRMSEVCAILHTPAPPGTGSVLDYAFRAEHSDMSTARPLSAVAEGAPSVHGSAARSHPEWQAMHAVSSAFLSRFLAGTSDSGSEHSIHGL